MTVDVAGERIELMPERGAHWRKAGAVLVADLHLGKSGVFRAAGMAVPDGDVHEQLDRLAQGLARTRAERLIIIGDLLHAPAGLTPSLVEAVAVWRKRHTQDWLVIPGNHDRRLEDLTDAWRLDIKPETYTEGPFRFRHEPAIGPGTPTDGFVWSGHTHPAVRLRLATGSVRLPAFVIGPHRAILPAFSRFTGGVAHVPEPADRLFAVTPNAVIEAPVELRA